MLVYPAIIIEVANLIRFKVFCPRELSNSITKRMENYTCPAFCVIASRLNIYEVRSICNKVFKSLGCCFNSSVKYICSSSHIGHCFCRNLNEVRSFSVSLFPAQCCCSCSKFGNIYCSGIDTSIGVVNYCNGVSVLGCSIFCCYGVGNRGGEILNITAFRIYCSIIRNCYCRSNCGNVGIPFSNCIYSINTVFSITNDCSIRTGLLACKCESSNECIVVNWSLSYSNCPVLNCCTIFCGNIVFNSA